jgi:hypothetical protein
MVRFVPGLTAAILAVGLTAAPSKADPYLLGVDLDLYPPPLTSPPPIISAPRVEYGCKRFWRCDTNVCEWRRGCWGLNGYVEVPYYTPAYARRQYQTYGLPKNQGATIATPPGVLSGPAPGNVAVPSPSVISTPTVVTTPPPYVITPAPVVDGPLVTVPPPAVVTATPQVVIAPPRRAAPKKRVKPRVEPEDQ